MTIERSSQVIKPSTQLRVVEQTRRGNRHGSSRDQLHKATMKDHSHRCVPKGVTDQEDPYGAKIYCDGNADRLEK